MSTSKVEATLEAAGKHAEVMVPLKVPPRAPLGPSETWGSCQLMACTICQEILEHVIPSETDTLFRDGGCLLEVLTGEKRDLRASAK